MAFHLSSPLYQMNKRVILSLKICAFTTKQIYNFVIPENDLAWSQENDTAQADIWATSMLYCGKSFSQVVRRIIIGISYVQ